MTDYRMKEPAEPTPANGAFKLLDYVTKGGPWALIVVIVLMVLGGEYGLFNSQTRRNAEAVEKMATQAVEQQKSLDKIVNILEEQRKIQAQAALIACFKEAKWDADRTECIRKFPIR